MRQLPGLALLPGLVLLTLVAACSVDDDGPGSTQPGSHATKADSLHELDAGPPTDELHLDVSSKIHGQDQPWSFSPSDATFDAGTTTIDGEADEATFELSLDTPEPGTTGVVSCSLREVFHEPTEWAIALTHKGGEPICMSPTDCTFCLATITTSGPAVLLEGTFTATAMAFPSGNEDGFWFGAYSSSFRVRRATAEP